MSSTLSGTERYTCSLHLVRRLWPVVDGEHYHGEIMRFRLVTEARGDVAPPPEPEQTIELRIGGTLLAERAWDVLSVREVADHGRAYVSERLQREGLPVHRTTTIVLNETTDGGAFRAGSPYTGDQLLPGRSFPVPARGHAATA